MEKAELPCEATLAKLECLILPIRTKENPLRFFVQEFRRIIKENPAITLDELAFGNPISRWTNETVNIGSECYAIVSSSSFTFSRESEAKWFTAMSLRCGLRTEKNAAHVFIRITCIKMAQLLLEFYSRQEEGTDALLSSYPYAPYATADCALHYSTIMKILHFTEYHYHLFQLVCKFASHRILNQYDLWTRTPLNCILDFLYRSDGTDKIGDWAVWMVQTLMTSHHPDGCSGLDLHSRCDFDATSAELARERVKCGGGSTAIEFVQGVLADMRPVPAPRPWMIFRNWPVHFAQISAMLQEGIRKEISYRTITLPQCLSPILPIVHLANLVIAFIVRGTQ